MIKSVGIYCSSYEDIAEKFFGEARLLAKWIGTTGKELVYGGTNRGMMQVIASTVKSNGGDVTGVIPQSILDRGLVSDTLDRKVVSQSLSDRKDILIELSDVIVVMPGGFGTLDEAFNNIAQRKLGYHQKEVLFCNINGIYDDMFSSINRLYAENFAPLEYKNYYKVFSGATDLIKYLETL